MKKFLIISVSFIFFITLIMFLISVFLFPIKYKTEINTYSKKYNLQPELVASIINVESGYNKNAISNAGALGLMQLMPSTAEEIATKLQIKDFNINNVETNIEFGCYYLNYLLNRYNKNLTLALAAYNAGLNNVDKWINNDEYFANNKLKNIPFKETENYIKKVNFNLKIYASKYNWLVKLIL